MNDEFQDSWIDPDNIDPENIDPDLQVRLLNLVMGEASDFEVDQLMQCMELRPEVASCYKELQFLHGMMTEIGTGEFTALDLVKEASEGEWKLSAERRQQVLDVISGVEQNPESQVVLSKPLVLTSLARWVSAAVSLGVACVLLSLFLLPSVQQPRMAARRFDDSRSEEGFGNFFEQPVPMDKEAPRSRYQMEQPNAAKGRADVETWSFRAKRGSSVDATEASSSSDLVRDLDLTTPTELSIASDFSDNQGQEVDKLYAKPPLPSVKLAPPSDLSVNGPLAADEFRSIEPKKDDVKTLMLGGVLLDDHSFESAKTDAGGQSLGGRANTGGMAGMSGKADTVDGRFRGRAYGGSSDDSEGRMKDQAGKSPYGAWGAMGTKNGGESIPSDLMADGDSSKPTDADSARVQWSEEKKAESTLMMDVTPRILIPEEGMKFEGEAYENEVAAEILSATVPAILPQEDEVARLSIDEVAGGESPLDSKFVEPLREEWESSDPSRLSGGAKEFYKEMSMGRDMVNGQTESIRKRLSPSRSIALEEQSASVQAFSTFSLHVSDVSFKLAQAALSQGQWPEASKIRIEEFVNAIDYHDPLPREGQKVSCRVEQAIHPFLMQRNLMRLSLRTAATGRAQSVPLRLTLLLDHSGSMERPDRQQILLRAMETMTGLLQPSDQVTLISFATLPRLLADRIPGDQASSLQKMIENLPSEGGTNIEAALQLAREKAIEHRLEGAENRIVLLTDGAVNLGNANPESLARMVTQLRDDGIAFDAAGIGAQDVNDEVLEALTRQGDGRYYLLDSLEAADSTFAAQIAGALRPSAKDVKVQIEFNPERVGRYKLLGYEKHRLEREDFRNDAVDAAELAAAEAGVAVYQFEAKPDGQGDIGTVFVRFRDSASDRIIEQRWPILFEPNVARMEQADPSMQLATTAALLATKLSGEPLSEDIDLAVLQRWLSRLPEPLFDQPRVQQLRTMIQQARELK